MRPIGTVMQASMTAGRTTQVSCKALPVIPNTLPPYISCIYTIQITTHSLVVLVRGRVLYMLQPTGKRRRSGGSDGSQSDSTERGHCART